MLSRKNSISYLFTPQRRAATSFETTVKFYLPNARASPYANLVRSYHVGCIRAENTRAHKNVYSDSTLGGKNKILITCVYALCVKTPVVRNSCF
jgi:hypothetical protein